MTDSVSEAPADFTADELAEAFITMRDERDRIRAQADKQIAEIEAAMGTVKERLLDMTRELNADSIRTASGTIIRSVRTKYWTSDWESLYRFITEHNAVALLEKRIAQKNMATFLEDHPNLMPEGLNIDRSYDITVRRAKQSD